MLNGAEAALFGLEGLFVFDRPEQGIYCLLSLHKLVAPTLSLAPVIIASQFSS